LKYKEPNSPKIVVLEQELVRAEAESLVAEAQLSNITREKLKAAFTYQFDAMREHCEKLAIIAGYGKHLLELIDDNPVTPGETRQAYDGYEASKAYVLSTRLVNYTNTPQHHPGLRRCPDQLGLPERLRLFQAVPAIAYPIPASPQRYPPRRGC
jgi:hypothetical protein